MVSQLEASCVRFHLRNKDLSVGYAKSVRTAANFSMQRVEDSLKVLVRIPSTGHPDCTQRTAAANTYSWNYVIAILNTFRVKPLGSM